jgi:hypothetical protein
VACKKGEPYLKHQAIGNSMNINGAISRYTPIHTVVISVKYFVLPVLHLSSGVNRYLPGHDLDLLGLKSVMEMEGVAQYHVYSGSRNRQLQLGCGAQFI